MLVNSDNIVDYALRHYIRNGVSKDDLLDDIQRISLINQSLKRFTPEKSPRVLVNQLITLFNTFETEAAIRMLVFRTEPKFYPRLKASLLTLGVWREGVCEGSFEPDHELMMALNNDLHDWRKYYA